MLIALSKEDIASSYSFISDNAIPRLFQASAYSGKILIAWLSEAIASS